MSKVRSLVSLEIDLMNLDEEWQEQSALYGRHAVQAADARRNWEEAKAREEVIKCETDRKIRQDPESFGIEKVSEARVANTVVLQPECQEAKRVVIRTRHEMDVVDGFVSALDHRKTAMSKLVDLFLADYFSRPKASGEAKEHVEKANRRQVRSGRERKKK